MTILVTYLEFTNGGSNGGPLSGSSISTQLDYAEWEHDGKVEYSHAIVEGTVRYDQGEVDGIPDDVRQMISDIVLKGAT